MIIRPFTPRFFTVGDRIRLSATVHNNTPDEQNVTVVLHADGLQLETEATQVVTLTGNTQQRVDWWVMVEDVGFVGLVFAAESDLGYQDAAIPSLTEGPDDTIPVYRYILAIQFSARAV